MDGSRRTTGGRFWRGGVAACLTLAVTTLAACGGGRVLPPASPVVSEPAGPPPPDAYRDFGGERVDEGVTFELDTLGRAVSGVEAVVRIDRVNTRTWVGSDGKEQVEGTAFVVVQRGTEEATVRVRQGEEGIALGVRVAIDDASVDYDDARSRWLPRATARITAAP